MAKQKEEVKTYTEDEVKAIVQPYAVKIAQLEQAIVNQVLQCSKVCKA